MKDQKEWKPETEGAKDELEDDADNERLWKKEKKLWEEIPSGEKTFQKREESSNVSHE